MQTGSCGGASAVNIQRMEHPSSGDDPTEKHGQSPAPGHSHGHGHAHGLRREGDRRALWIAFAITFLFMLAEAAGGWLSDSLALLADAGHMLTDVAALGLSLAAMWLAQRPARNQRTYGLLRAEILAALLNGVTLWVLCGLIFYNAYLRFHAPPAVESSLMLVIAVLGLVANAATFWVLWKSGGESLNLRGALLHVFGDMLGSVGAIGAALAIRFTGWLQADPLISVLIAAMIVVGAYRLVAETVRVLLEIAPSHIDPKKVEASLLEIPGVAEVHSLHIWTITSGVEAISGHLRLSEETVDAERLRDVLHRAQTILARYHITHMTLQVEPSQFASEKMCS
jgi:cobalt-zinc-cadmium efflux system protein